MRLNVRIPVTEVRLSMRTVGNSGEAEREDTGNRGEAEYEDSR